jgi:hypothetical protein
MGEKISSMLNFCLDMLTSFMNRALYCHGSDVPNFLHLSAFFLEEDSN